MALSYARPNETLARELREVARDATGLIEALTNRPNFILPPDFPKDQLIDIGHSLVGLPGGTAEGCRASLEYARNRLPAIRRAYILSEELDLLSSNPDVSPPLVRGALVDQRLRDLIASVTTALDEYRREAAEDAEEDTTPQETISASAGTVDPAVAQSTRLESRLAEAKVTVAETTNPDSVNAENLLRQISDARGLNRIARTELVMPRIVVHWYRRTVHALRDYPRLIKKTATDLKDGADILHVGVERWHDFKRNSTTFLFDEFKKTCDSFVVVGTKLDELKAKKPSRGASPKAKSSSRPEPPEDFDLDKVYQMIIAGVAPPESWWPFIDHLRLGIKDRKTEIVDLKPIADLKFINWLEIWRSPVSDLTPIADLKRLKFLNLTETQVSDVTPLSKLRALDELYLDKTPITDISALASLKRLRRLNLSDTSISDISALALSVSLERLNLENTRVYDLRPLSKLKRLTELRLANTPVRDITSLSGLTSLRTIDLEGTQITSVHALRRISLLEDLNIARTQVKSVSSLRGRYFLERLDIRRTLVTDVSPLDRISGLNIVGAKTQRVLKRRSARKKKTK